MLVEQQQQQQMASNMLDPSQKIQLAESEAHTWPEQAASLLIIHCLALFSLSHSLSPALS